MVSSIERFHCIQDSQLCSNGGVPGHLQHTRYTAHDPLIHTSPHFHNNSDSFADNTAQDFTNKGTQLLLGKSGETLTPVR